MFAMLAWQQNYVRMSVHGIASNDQAQVVGGVLSDVNGPFLCATPIPVQVLHVFVSE